MAVSETGVPGHCSTPEPTLDPDWVVDDPGAVVEVDDVEADVVVEDDAVPLAPEQAQRASADATATAARAPRRGR